MESNETQSPEKEYDGHKLAKMLLIAVASFAVAKAIETAYNSALDRRDNSESTD